ISVAVGAKSPGAAAAASRSLLSPSRSPRSSASSRSSKGNYRPSGGSSMPSTSGEAALDAPEPVLSDVASRVVDLLEGSSGPSVQDGASSGAASSAAIRSGGSASTTSPTSATSRSKTTTKKASATPRAGARSSRAAAGGAGSSPTSSEQGELDSIPLAEQRIVPRQVPYKTQQHPATPLLVPVSANAQTGSTGGSASTGNRAA
ncbi:unnamed protein product, partial [Amoebophrya sp. A120]